VPWAQKVLPAIEELVDRHPERTLFTRFISAARPGEAPGMWARYYRCWANVTLVNIDTARRVDAIFGAIRAAGESSR
jgi:hypothetical protein